jgi:hypothetical protein
MPFEKEETFLGMICYQYETLIAFTVASLPYGKVGLKIFEI